MPFVRDVLDYFESLGIRVQQVRTDHGTEFTHAMFPHVQVEHPFERELRTQGISHKLTPSANRISKAKSNAPTASTSTSSAPRLSTAPAKLAGAPSKATSTTTTTTDPTAA